MRDKILEAEYLEHSQREENFDGITGMIVSVLLSGFLMLVTWVVGSIIYPFFTQLLDWWWSY